MSGRIILIRHAETDGNKTRYVGREDVPLNATGEQQAKDLALALRDQTINAIFSSPMKRTLATAGPLALQRGMEIRQLSGLMEIDYGSLQGNLKGEKPFNLRRKYFDTPMPGGESLRNVWERLHGASGEILASLREHACVAIVGHYWTNRLLASQLIGRTLETSLDKGGYRPENASAYVMDVHDGLVHTVFWLHPNLDR